MSSYDVTLNSATRTNLLSLQNTASLAATNQQRLSTGKAVNSAIDNPVNYFTAAGLTDRATALSGLLDGISNGVQTIQAASKGIDSITTLVKQLQSTIKQAQSDAATNLPELTTSTSLASSTEATGTGKSQHDTALAKSLFGSTTAASSSTNGIVGFTDNSAAATTSPAAAAITNDFRLQAGSTTYDVTLSPTATLGDLVNGINKSGIATASVDSNGNLTVKGTGSDGLTMDTGKMQGGVYTSNATGTGSTATNADLTALFGTNGNQASKTSNIASTTTSAERSSLISQFNDVRDQIDSMASDSGYNGTNLLGGDKLSIAFNEKTGTAQSKLDVQGSSLTSESLGIGELVDSTTSSTGSDFSVQNNSDLSKAADTLTNALSSLKSLSSTLGSNLATVQTRQDFTKNISDVLTTGASNLTDADMNAEAAKSQALSTRQSLGISALSLANTASQGILQLLR